MDNGYDIKAIHGKILSMMEWFHSFCVENNITYYMSGGTMLGAVRHQGFIPWDDDFDVVLPREDFDRLIEISKKLPSGSKYVIESYKDGKEDFEYLYAKVYDTETTLIEKRRKQTKRGLFIDVFPMDGIAGDTIEEAKAAYRPLNKYLNKVAAVTCDVREGRAWWKNLIVRMVGILPSSWFSFSKMAAKIEKKCKENSFYSSKYVGLLVGTWREKELVPREYYGEPVLYQFEGCGFYGPQEADEYLTNLYGDWRTLPPEEKRKSDHAYLHMDLEHSYLK